MYVYSRFDTFEAFEESKTTGTELNRRTSSLAAIFAQFSLCSLNLWVLL